MEVMRVLAALNRVWVALEPERWTQCPWGDKTGGFWAVAVRGNRVLWFNEIEEGLMSRDLSHGGSFRTMSTGAIRTRCARH